MGRWGGTIVTRGRWDPDGFEAQTPQFAFQRPYTVDLTGWFDDFSHSGIYDALGSASRDRVASVFGSTPPTAGTSSGLGR